MIFPVFSIVFSLFSGCFFFFFFATETDTLLRMNCDNGNKMQPVQCASCRLLSIVIWKYVNCALQMYVLSCTYAFRSLDPLCMFVLRATCYLPLRCPVWFSFFLPFDRRYQYKIQVRLLRSRGRGARGEGEDQKRPKRMTTFGGSRPNGRYIRIISQT